MIPPRDRIPNLVDLDVEITTARTKLRPFRDDDVEAIWPWVSDPAFPRQMSWAAHVERSETLDYIHGTHAARAEGSGLVWAIERGGKAVGSVGLEGDRVDAGARGASIAADSATGSRRRSGARA